MTADRERIAAQIPKRPSVASSRDAGLYDRPRVVTTYRPFVVDGHEVQVQKTTRRVRKLHRGRNIDSERTSWSATIDGGRVRGSAPHHLYRWLRADIRVTIARMDGAL